MAVDTAITTISCPAAHTRSISVDKQKFGKKTLKNLLRRRSKGVKQQGIDTSSKENVRQDVVAVPDATIPEDISGVEEEALLSTDRKESVKTLEIHVNTLDNRKDEAVLEGTRGESIEEQHGQSKEAGDERNMLIGELRTRNEELTIINKTLQEALEWHLRENHRMVETLQNELGIKTNEIELLRLSSNEREQRIRYLEILLGNVHESGQETETRLRILEQAVDISADDIHITPLKLGSGSFGGKNHFVYSSIFFLIPSCIYCMDTTIYTWVSHCCVEILFFRSQDWLLAWLSSCCQTL